MIIQTISYCRTVQAKQYEPVKIEVAGVPGEGQTAAEAFTELMQFVDGQIAAACASTNGAPVGTSKPADPPLKAKSKPSDKAARQAAMNKGNGSDPTDPPFAANKTASTTQSNGNKSEPPATNGKPKPAEKSKSQKELREAFDKEVSYTMESQSLEELASRFIDLTDMAKGITFKVVSTDEYCDVLDGVSDRYQQLGGNSGSDPDSSKVIIARGKAERQRVAHALQELANAKLQEAAA